MPNHVTNVIRFDCSDEEFKRIAESVRREGSYVGSVDFEKLIPMPKELDIPCGSVGKSGCRLYMEYLSETEGIKDKKVLDQIWEKYEKKVSDTPEALELGKKYYENIEKYGYPTWYEWSVDNWGTKWNAYDCAAVEEGRHELRFCTAWSAVPQVVKTISENYPDAVIDYAWADEDIGSNVGTVRYERGKITDISIPTQGSREAYELSADIQDLDLEEMGFEFSEEENTYVWRDREDMEEGPER